MCFPLESTQRILHPSLVPATAQSNKLRCSGFFVCTGQKLTSFFIKKRGATTVAIPKNIHHLFFLITSLLVFLSSGCTGTFQPPATNTTLPPYTFSASSGDTTGPLTVRSIELKFQNGLGDITLTSETSPQPEAIIKFDGNGLFQAYWQVDGRDIEPIGINVTFGKTLKLRFSNIAQIPTFQPGPHHISLRITNPQTNLTSPVITYFVQMQ